jgi:hypothetical protein
MGCAGAIRLLVNESDMGVFARMIIGLAGKAADTKAISIASYLKTYRTASSLRVKTGAWTPDRAHQGGVRSCMP